MQRKAEQVRIKAFPSAFLRSSVLLSVSFFSMGAPIYAQEASVIPLPIRVNLDTVFQEVEKQAPRVPPGVDTWTPLPGQSVPGTYYRFNAYRDGLEYWAQGTRMSLRTKLHYWMEAGIQMTPKWIKGVGSCGLGSEPHREASITLETEVGFGPQWTLAFKTEVKEVQALNPCQITAFKFDITAKVTEGMKAALLKAASEADKLIASNTLLRDRAQAAWLQAQEPVALDQNLWLLLNPEKIRISPVKGEGRSLLVVPEIEARPMVVLGAKPYVTQKPLPPLEIAQATREGFHIRVEAELPYKEAGEELTKRIQGLKIEGKKGISYSVELLDGKIAPQGDLLLLDILTKGTVKGRVKLAGKPVFDPALGRVKLADLDFTLESKGFLAKVGNWLYHRDLKKLIQEKMDALLNQQLEDTKAKVQAALNRPLSPHLEMQGRLDALSVPEIQLGPQSLKVTATLNGKVQVDVR